MTQTSRSKLVYEITKKIMFEDCGNTADWKDNINLGEAVVAYLEKEGVINVPDTDQLSLGL